MSEVRFVFLKRNLLDMGGGKDIVLVYAGVFRRKTIDNSRNAGSVLSG